MTSPSRSGQRHLVCHFYNDGGVKRPGGEEEMGDLKGRGGEEGGGEENVFIVRDVSYAVSKEA